jgi:hypothetical protein
MTVSVLGNHDFQKLLQINFCIISKVDSKTLSSKIVLFDYFYFQYFILNFRVEFYNNIEYNKIYPHFNYSNSIQIVIKLKT